MLFRDGIVERSHICLIEYLKERYLKTGRMSEALINTLDSARVDRHETLSGWRLEAVRGKPNIVYRELKSSC